MGSPSSQRHSNAGMRYNASTAYAHGGIGSSFTCQGPVSCLQFDIEVGGLSWITNVPQLIGPRPVESNSSVSVLLCLA